MSVDTRELLNRLKASKDIREFILQNEEEFLSIPPIEYLNEALASRDMSLSDVAKNSGRGEYVYKVFRGERKASRDVLVAIAIGMRMSIEESQLLLRISRLAPLDARSRRDSIIIYSIKEGKDIFLINDLLYELGEKTL